MTRTENPALAVLPLFTGMHLLGWSEGQRGQPGAGAAPCRTAGGLPLLG